LLTLSDALAAYRFCAKAEGKSPKTLSWVTDAVHYFADFLGQDSTDLSSVNAWRLRQFIVALQAKRAFSQHRFTKPQDRGLSPETICSYTRAIKSFFSFLNREELIPNNPMAKVKLPKVPIKVIATFTERQLERLLSQPNKKTAIGYRDYTIMLTLLDTAARLSELLNITLDDVDLEAGVLKVMGKGSKERYLPFGAKVTKALLKYRLKYRPDTTCQGFFVTAAGQPLTKTRVEHMMRAYGQVANIKGVRCSPHTFRHTSSLGYLRNGGDPFSLQKKLGHSSLAMTRRYSNLTDSDVRAAHAKFGVADRLKV